MLMKVTTLHGVQKVYSKLLIIYLHYTKWQEIYAILKFYQMYSEIHELLVIPEIHCQGLANHFKQHIMHRSISQLFYSF